LEAKVTHRLVQKLIPLLGRVCLKGNCHVVLTSISDQLLDVLHVLTLDTLHLSTSIFDHFSNTLSAVVRSPLFVYLCFLKVSLKVVDSNSTVSTNYTFN